ncbi:MAG: transglycosylase domain-containing protein [Acidobacteriota bacterium]
MGGWFLKRPTRPPAWVFSGALTLLVALPGGARDLSDNPLLRELGRNESLVLSEPYPIVVGGTVTGYALPERLEALGYERVSGRRPERAGEYFWGHEVFWIYRRAQRVGDTLDERLVGLELDGRGRIVGLRDADGRPIDRALRLDAEVLAETLGSDRAARLSLRLEEVPEPVWRSVLAAEDARFFDHVGLDGRALARALLQNVRSGFDSPGGSTITQQLIKNRDLTPRRSLGRKASEAVRALALEAQVDKEHILEAYLDQVYLGNLDGLAVHGLGAGAEVFFSTSVQALDLAQAATLAGMIQSPNRYQPPRNAERLLKRRDWVLGRLETLGWVSAEEASAARAKPLGARLSPPRRPPAEAFVRWIAAEVAEQAPERVARDRGVVVQSRLDPQLQRWADEAVAQHLRRLERDGHGGARVALVSLEATTGAVLAYVGGDPRVRDGFDRVRRARRQPGSLVKPLILLEAFERCGGRDPLTPASRLVDEPIRVELPTSIWRPGNDDGRFVGVLDVRRSLVESRNVPFVRIARHCGWDPVAALLRRGGLDLPTPPPPSFALGSVEATPLDVAAAYTAFANRGDASAPWPWSTMDQPGGRLLVRQRTREKHLAGADTAFLVHDLMLDAVRKGTAGAAALDELEAAAKTGTTDARRDAWLAGHANGVVTVVWVGRDDGRPLGLSGGVAAAPLWREFMNKAGPARPPRPVERPSGVVTRSVDPETGLLVRSFNARAVPEIFRRGALPRRDRFWRDDTAIDPIE